MPHYTPSYCGPETHITGYRWGCPPPKPHYTPSYGGPETQRMLELVRPTGCLNVYIIGINQCIDLLTIIHLICYLPSKITIGIYRNLMVAIKVIFISL